MFWPSCGTWLWSEAVDAAQDVGEQVPGNGDLGHLECDVAPVAYDLAANLDQPVSQCHQRPLLDGLRQRQGAQKVAQIVGQGMQLQPHGVEHYVITSFIT